MRTKKEKWMESLKVGDTVCDCRFKHSVIKEIHDSRWKQLPTTILRILMAIPGMWRVEPFITMVFGRIRLMDRVLLLEDGTRCSALYCCDPPDHKENHPEKVTLNYSKIDFLG